MARRRAATRCTCGNTLWMTTLSTSADPGSRRRRYRRQAPRSRRSEPLCCRCRTASRGYLQQVLILCRPMPLPGTQRCRSECRQQPWWGPPRRTRHRSRRVRPRRTPKTEPAQRKQAEQRAQKRAYTHFLRFFAGRSNQIVTLSHSDSQDARRPSRHEPRSQCGRWSKRLLG